MSREAGSPGAVGPAQPPGLAEPVGFHEPAGRAEAAGLAEDADLSLPLLPGFREMALRRMSQERRRLVSELAAQRQSAGLSQTEVAARMGTSQSAVARLESGGADVRVSTLERYAAAIGSQISWRVLDSRPGGQEELR
ncbi:MAG TPA: helix-turn-helix transcriptional regulator [Streptosporangiaceae bacterium]